MGQWKEANSANKEAEENIAIEAENINIIYLLIHLNLYRLTEVIYLLKPPQEISIFFPLSTNT